MANDQNYHLGRRLGRIGDGSSLVAIVARCFHPLAECAQHPQCGVLRLPIAIMRQLDDRSRLSISSPATEGYFLLIVP